VVKLFKKGEIMNAIEKLRELKLPADTMVSLSYSEGASVFVHNDTAVDTAVENTDVISVFSELVATPKLNVYDNWGNHVLNDLRNSTYLDAYEPRDFYFSEFITQTLVENFCDIEFIDASVEQYDYKRGYCTLSADVRVPIDELLTNENVSVGGWTISVKTDHGTLTFEA